MPIQRSCAAWAATDTGLVRASNEDICAVPGWRSGPERERWCGSLSANGGWALVADGMGGHAAGDVASALAVEALAPWMQGLTDRDQVAAALDTANARLYGAVSTAPALAGMGTTVAGVVLHDNEVLAFNVGDSRIYASTGTGLVRISEDHALGGGVLTQCLGGSRHPMPLDPLVARVRWEDVDLILLCSDGLTNMVDDAGIAGLLLARPENPADAFVEAALVAGGIDNVTVIVIDPPR